MLTLFSRYLRALAVYPVKGKHSHLPKQACPLFTCAHTCAGG